jgi:hypothetical protein
LRTRRSMVAFANRNMFHLSHWRPFVLTNGQCARIRLMECYSSLWWAFIENEDARSLRVNCTTDVIFVILRSDRGLVHSRWNFFYYRRQHAIPPTQSCRTLIILVDMHN